MKEFSDAWRTDDLKTGSVAVARSADGVDVFSRCTDVGGVDHCEFRAPELT